MNVLAEIATYLLQTLGGIYLLIVMLRFLFQVVRADFYNPVSKFIANATSPILMPLRKVIPSIYRYDTASLVLAFVVQGVIIFLTQVFAGLTVDVLPLFIFTSVALLALVLTIFFVSLVIMIIASFVAPRSVNPIIFLAGQLADPLCMPFRRAIPPMGGIDISPIFVFVILHIASLLIKYLAETLGMSGVYLHLIGWI